MADEVVRALRSEQGSVLVFLPGAAEIRRTESLLREQVRDPAVVIVPLFGGLKVLETQGKKAGRFGPANTAVIEKLIEAGSNPDKLAHEELAAELTNHLIPGVILTPGAVGTLPELQQVGFRYAK